VILSSLCALSFLYGFARWRHLDHSAGASSQPLPVPYLALVPSQVLLYLWTLVICTFVEQNIFTLVINGATVFYGGKYLERAWGSREFGKFILVVSLASNIAMTFLYLSWAAITRQSAVAYASSSRSLLHFIDSCLRFSLK
jgi:membrane associated rhomboid family serine protease